MRLYTILKKIIELFSVDYVVEEGSYNGFEYRKWNSGKMEVWGTVSVTATNYATIGSFYGYYATVALPEVCQFISAPKMNYNVQVGSGFAVPGSATMGVTATQFNWYALATASGSQWCTVSFELKGRWKA